MNLVYNFRDLIQTKQRQLIGVNPISLAMLASITPKIVLFIVTAENSIVCRLFLCPKTNKNEEKR